MDGSGMISWSIRLIYHLKLMNKPFISIKIKLHNEFFKN